VTEFDNTWFTLMTLNTNPLHFDAAFAAKSQHGSGWSTARWGLLIKRAM
jgi:acyl dehydratase